MSAWKYRLMEIIRFVTIWITRYIFIQFIRAFKYVLFYKKRLLYKYFPFIFRVILYINFSSNLIDRFIKKQIV